MRDLSTQCPHVKGALRRDGNGHQGYLFEADHITACDITAGSLLMFVMWPATADAYVCEFSALPPQYQATIQGLRDTPAGRYVMWLVSNHRRQ